MTDHVHRGSYFDARFAAYRCSSCGHRFSNADGSPVRETRTFPVRMWARELIGRSTARKQGKQ